MSLVGYRPVDSLAMTVVLGLLALLAGSAVLGVIALLWKVMHLVHLVQVP